MNNPLRILTRRSKRTCIALVVIVASSFLVVNLLQSDPTFNVVSYSKKLLEYSSYPKQCRPFFFHSLYGNNLTIQDHESFFVSEVNKTVDIPHTIHYLNYNAHIRTSRYLCSLESALRQNPSHLIYVYTPTPENLAQEMEKWRAVQPDANKRVILRKMDYAGYFHNTPLEDWYASKKHEKSWWIDQNLGNAFRLAGLWN